MHIYLSFSKPLFFTKNKQEVERSWREYDKLEADVILAKNNLLEQLEALGSPQVRAYLSETAPVGLKHKYI